MSGARPLTGRARCSIATPSPDEAALRDRFASFDAGATFSMTASPRMIEQHDPSDGGYRTQVQPGEFFDFDDPGAAASPQGAPVPPFHFRFDNQDAYTVVTFPDACCGRPTSSRPGLA